MHRFHRRLACLALAGLLSLPLARTASAVSYSDLPESHWAYADMIHAARLGILKGTGNNQMAPSAVLSWGQYLAMLTRAFAPQGYQSAMDSGLAWDQAGYQAALDAGLILENDFLPVDMADLGASITRQDVAVLLYRALSSEALGRTYSWSPSAEELSDWGSLDPQHQEAVAALVKLEIIRGKSDSSFGGSDPLQRCDGSVLLIRAVAAEDRVRSGDEMDLTLRFVDTSGKAVGSEVSVSAYVGQSSSYLTSEYAPAGYTYDYSYSDYFSVSSIQSSYTLTVRAMTWAEMQEEEFWDKVDRGEATFEDYYKQDFWLKCQGENPRKCLLLFGDENKRRFDSYEEAQASMATITVPIWKLSNGTKVSSTTTLTVHSAIAEDVKAIFTEIYNDPEQFPINATSTFRYVEGTTGEHNCGTAIDLNANENYQVRDGKAMVGNFWRPGENPYSIPEDGSVVRIFAEHGWSWGGDAWAWDSDQTTGYHDYMHFSYMGG